MLREVLCLLAGFGIIAAVTIDVVWTTLGTHGGGPISPARPSSPCSSSS
jgi:hypothetical protein